MAILRTLPGQAALTSKGFLGGMVSFASGLLIFLGQYGLIPVEFASPLVALLAAGSGLVASWGRVAATESITSVLPSEGSKSNGILQAPKTKGSER